MKSIVVIYHANCPDGFGAALAAWLAFGETAEYWPAAHGSWTLPALAGRDVYILDFSFEPEVLRSMEEQCRSLTLLDHHKTAQEKLKGYRCLCAKLHFDMTKCGARLAWEHFHPEVPVPYLVERIEDRDLWRWEFPDSRRFLARLDCEPRSFERWAQILDQTQTEAGRRAWLEEGAVLEMQTEKMLSDLLDKAQPCVFRGIPGLMMNCAQQELISNLGNRLAQRSQTYGLVWSIEDAKLLKISLRSIAPFDVSALAVQLGGGGHAQASGCQLPKEKILDLLAGAL